jgi:death-on-curing protein
MKEPLWLTRATVDDMHALEIAEHGGSRGVRNSHLIESALARPQHVYAYDDKCDIATLAAAYAFGLAKNHGYIDGNKRTAFVAAYAFLNVNGYDIDPTSEADVERSMVGVASGKVTESELAAWLRSCMRKSA